MTNQIIREKLRNHEKPIFSLFLPPTLKSHLETLFEDVRRNPPFHPGAEGTNDLTWPEGFTGGAVGGVHCLT